MLKRYIVKTSKREGAASFRQIRPLAYTAASGFGDRAKITILDVCERLRGPQETWEGASQQEGDDRENDHDFEEHEDFLNVFITRHSQKAGWFHRQERIRGGTFPVFVDSVYKTLVQYGRVGTHGIPNRQFKLLKIHTTLDEGAV